MNMRRTFRGRLVVFSRSSAQTLLDVWETDFALPGRMSGEAMSPVGRPGPCGKA